MILNWIELFGGEKQRAMSVCVYMYLNFVFYSSCPVLYSSCVVVPGEFINFIFIHDLFHYIVFIFYAKLKGLI